MYLKPSHSLKVWDNGTYNYVYAGPGGHHDYQFWKISQVGTSKYFTIKCQGKYADGPASLEYDPTKNKEYIVATNQESDKIPPSHQFTISCQDDEGKSIRLISSVKGACPNINSSAVGPKEKNQLVFAYYKKEDSCCDPDSNPNWNLMTLKNLI